VDKEDTRKAFGNHSLKGIERIALPLAGAGKGGVNPKISLSITEEVLRDVPSEVYICLDKLLPRLRNVCCQDFIL
jgi:hypothetical protein